MEDEAVRRSSADDPAPPAFAAYAASAAALTKYQSSPTGSIRLFDPNRLLAILAVLFWPLKFLPIVLVPAVLLAGLTMFKHLSDINADLQQTVGKFSFIIYLLLNLLIVNLSARLSMGAVVRAFGEPVRDFGFMLLLGSIPRFYIDRSAIPRLNRNGRLWAHGTPLLVRLGFFASGMLAWATYRSSGTEVANFALLISQAGLWAFLFAMIPLLPGDGYYWLATYFRRPMLRRKALMALTAKLRGRQLPPSIPRGEVPILLIFAVSTILAIVALAFAVLIIWGMLLTELQGIGALIFLLVVASFATWLLSFKARLAGRWQQPKEIRFLQAVMAAQADSPEPIFAPSPLRRAWRWRVWACVVVALILIAFLPCSYDPAGPFKILPSQRSHAIARTDGEVVDIIVREGDWVNVGQVLAHLSSSDQQRDLVLTREELERAEARVARFDGKSLNTAPVTNELVRRSGVAQNEVERLRHQLQHHEAELDRTTIRAPAAGLVTTPEERFLTGSWLNAGDEFLQIDDTRAVEAEIEIPQNDIALIKPGAKVRLRPWSERDEEIVGSVVEFTPAALDKMDNGVIRVKALAPNAETRLRPAMTGYARISGPEMTVWRAYLRVFIRLLTVELWRWIP